MFELNWTGFLPSYILETVRQRHEQDLLEKGFEPKCYLRHQMKPSFSERVPVSKEFNIIEHGGIMKDLCGVYFPLLQLRLPQPK